MLRTRIKGSHSLPRVQEDSRVRGMYARRGEGVILEGLARCTDTDLGYKRITRG